jgi:hypothetical protein
MTTWKKQWLFYGEIEVMPVGTEKPYDQTLATIACLLAALR